MFVQDQALRDDAAANAPFLPLAFRLGAAFGLMVLQLALPVEGPVGPPGETFYMVCLALLFLEGVWEVSRALNRGGQPFETPAPAWIRFNLLLDAALVTLLIAFHGVDQERLATIYIFPVLASAFYLRNYEIVGVGILSSAFHITSALLFSYGVLGPFGGSGEAPGLAPARLTFILGFATLQIFAATLVVVVIRKNLESLRQNLSESEAVVDELSAMYRRVFESMLAGLITVDLQGAITSANPAAEKILQRPLSAGLPIAGQGFGDLAALSSHLGEQRFELNFTTTGGERRIIGGNLVPLRSPEGATTGNLLVFQDLTEIKLLEERTRLSERLATVGELSSEMAHELRNPMASILGCVQILKQGEQSRPMMDRVLTILWRESERVSAIVTDFLDFSRPRPVRIQAIGLRHVVEEFRASWETDPRCEGLHLEVEPVPELTVLGDPVWVHQVFTNLLSNARKALRDTPEPVIRLSFQPRPRSGTVVATVSDNGCGMSEERRRAVFIPFSSGFEEGTGLGMSLVFQFVQQMGWSIQVESTLGGGTRVALTLPVQAGNLSAGT
jgi:two-component system sensor histidine kinase PilS (NtrC family)